MNKFLALVGAAMLSVTSAFAYTYICFYPASGETPIAVPAEGLVITVDGNNLLASPSQGDAVSIPLNDLSSMEFSWTALGIDEIFDGSAPVAVFDLGGVSAGEFGSLDEARQSLPAGIYLINSNGKSFKILLGK